MLHNVRDLSPDQRLAIESLLWRRLRAEESLIRPARLLKDAPSGAERTRSFRQYLVAAGADVLCVRDRHFYDPAVVAFCRREDIWIMDDLTLLELLAVKP